MRKTLLQSLARGPLTEPPPPADDAALAELATQVDRAARRRLGRSLSIREVDAGSCNGCEIEIGQAFSPVYDAERYGVRLVASPRHADAIVVTGPVTHNMADALRKTYDAAPRPCLVVALGDCARDCGMFAGGHGVAGPVADFVPVDVEVPGCPPPPDVVVAALRGLSGR